MMQIKKKFLATTGIGGFRVTERERAVKKPSAVTLAAPCIYLAGGETRKRQSCEQCTETSVGFIGRTEDGRAYSLRGEEDIAPEGGWQKRKKKERDVSIAIAYKQEVTTLRSVSEEV